MTRRRLTRRDFLKLAAVGTAAAVPVAMGVKVYSDALGEYPLVRSPYAESLETSNLDGSVPILMLLNRSSKNPFGAYLGEMLRAEGLNCFHMTDVSNAQAHILEKYSVVILAEGTLTTEQVEMVKEYVARGGSLVGMKPDNRLESIFGVERSGGNLSGGYLKVDSDHPAGAGINPSTLQIHDTAHFYKTEGAQVIAWLYEDRDTPSGYPAVTVHSFGKGLASAWAFDLAKSVAYMRQGNPHLIDADMDGLEGARTVDRFVNWIDLERIEIPQADEQQRLFANVLSFLSRIPLPRFWYFPASKKSVLIVTGDSHANPARFIEETLSRVEQYGAHMTVYYSPLVLNDLNRAGHRLRFLMTDHVPVVGGMLRRFFGSPTMDDISAWRARGHEIALHPYVDDGLWDGWQEYWKEFTGRGYGPVPSTVRTHRVLWTGWVESARLQASLGIRMNFDYYHVGPSLQKRNGEWVNGHLTGSGRPMRFIDAQGNILNIYQQLTQIVDEHLLPMDVPGWGGWPQCSPQEAVEVAKSLLDRSVNQGDYCALGAQFHVDPFQVGGEAAEKAALFLEGTLDSARELDVPMISAQEWLTFTEDRAESRLENLMWDSHASSLTFSLYPPEGAVSPLDVMIPLRHNSKSLVTLSVDGLTESYRKQRVGGVEYASVTVKAKSHTIRASYA